MELLNELVKISDELDKEGLSKFADMIDGLIAKAAAKSGPQSPMLSIHVKRSDEDDNVWIVKVDAPSGVSPYDPVIHAYIQKYNPFRDGFNLAYKEMKSNSDPNKPNTFIYELHGRQENNEKVAMPKESLEALVKVADELDKAGANDLADRIDKLIKGE